MKPSLSNLSRKRKHSDGRATGEVSRFAFLASRFSLAARCFSVVDPSPLYLCFFLIVLSPPSGVHPSASRYRSVPFRAVPCRSVPFRAVPCRSVPFRAVRCRSVPFRAVPCRSYSHIKREDMTSFDKMFKSLQSSLKAVQESPAVRSRMTPRAAFFALPSFLSICAALLFLLRCLDPSGF